MNRDVAQLVSAPALGAGGPAFESQYPDELEKNSLKYSEFFCYMDNLYLPLEYCSAVLRNCTLSNAAGLAIFE